MIRVDFLKDTERKIFVRRVKDLDIVKVLGLTEFNKDLQIEYVHMLRSHIQPERYVKTKHKIVSIKQVYTKKLVHVWYPVF